MRRDTRLRELGLPTNGVRGGGVSGNASVLSACVDGVATERLNKKVNCLESHAAPRHIAVGHGPLSP